MFPATRNCLNSTRDGASRHGAKIFAEQLAILQWNLLRREASYLNMRARCEGHAAHVTTNRTMEVFHSR
ncbi:MAG: hypothetical protein JWO04_4502 [Gammaproteobacteria bacterium]|jgi:hypothetical protein|nr:hypothetical protein [Gammaproteobacteria bacterium]